MAQIGKFDYAISQSVSSSFQQGDTLEVTFQAKGSSGLSNSTDQKVNLFYSLNSESINWVEVANFPKTFGVGTSYVTKSFTTPINATWQAVKAIVTGSVFTSSAFSQTNPGAPVGAISIDYDDFKITSYAPKSELTDEGLLVFRSPSQFIKVDENGVQVKGGSFETERIVTEQLEVFGDITVFGDFQASDIDPYAGTMTDIATEGAVGTAVEYSRGDHTHDLPFSTVNSVIGEGQITSPLHATNITASNDISASGDIISKNLIVEDNIFLNTLSTSGTAITEQTSSIFFGANSNDDMMIRGYNTGTSTNLLLHVRDDGADSIRIETTGHTGDRVDARGDIKIQGGSITNTISGDSADSFNVFITFSINLRNLLINASCSLPAPDFIPCNFLLIAAACFK